jgi:hypothetical protein
MSRYFFTAGLVPYKNCREAQRAQSLMDCALRSLRLRGEKYNSFLKKSLRFT